MQTTFGAVALQPAFGLDQLPGETVAGETRQTQVGGAGNDAFLACRQRHERVRRRQHVVHRQQNLAVAADRPSFDRCDPRLFDAGAVDVVRQDVGGRDAAEIFVHETKFALHIPKERDRSAIQMGQVDAGAEDAPPGVFGVRDRLPAQHRDIGSGVEGRHIDADLHRIDGALVLGVQITRVAAQQVRRPAVPFDPHRPEIDKSLRVQRRQRRRRFRARQQHRVAQMRAAARMRQDVREQQALVDFQALLFLQREAGLGCELLAGRHQSRIGFGGLVRRGLRPGRTG